MKLFFSGIFFVLILNTIAQTNVSDSIINQKMYAAQLLLSNNKGNYNEAKAFDIYLDCAKLGKPQAMLMVGYMYRDGKGVSQSSSKAEEWFIKAATKKNAIAYYHLGMLYKNGDGANQDFYKAFYFFEKGTLSGNALCEYNMAYMLYKGIGCKQNYQQAVSIFLKQAYGGNINSMYFYGIALRNGYGISRNLDSAMFWLNAAANKGNYAAKKELSLHKAESENKDAKKAFDNLKPFTPTTNINQYHKIENKVNAIDIIGSYSGSLITYDWSGTVAIEATPLQLTLILANDNKIEGYWIQSDSIIIPFTAMLTKSGIVFNNTFLQQKTHYSYNVPVTIQIEKAKLQRTKKNDSTYIFGNVQMYLPNLKEPYKPQYVSLFKVNSTIGSSQWLDITKDDGSVFIPNSLKAYPNPFTNTINIEFEIKQKGNVTTELKNTQGALIYSNTANLTQPGFYTLPLKPTQVIASGVYIINIKMGNIIKAIKIIKL